MSFQAKTPRLLLASQSQARAGLLRRAGLVFETVPAHIDETTIKQAALEEGASPQAAAETLALLKAQRISRGQPEALIIGADQLLVCDGDWFDKPNTMAEAERQLRTLRGKRHTLVTSVVCVRNDQRVWAHTSFAHLTMRAFSETFLKDYLERENDALCASVGAYRLEGFGVHLFDAIEGDDSTILGLPILPLLGFLRQHRVLAE